ncbi:MAG: mandelate racemase/muconate lactonizing protein [Rhodospirillaceae bacterium]|nr:mandelate racemase/muconate lactonizing protein [Rhodospirillaceae bacterium]
MADGPIIERIEFTAFEISVPDLTCATSGFGVSFTPGKSPPQLRFGLKIYTDTGVIGEYVPGRSRAQVIMTASEALAHSLIGKPALERESHFAAMRRLCKHVGEVGIGALDIALWDLAGKHYNAPVSELIGGFRKRLPAYASTLHGDREPTGLSSAEAYADFAERCYEMGYRAFKIHGWSAGDVEEESAMLRAVAGRVGDKMVLMYDAACHSKTLADAIQIGKVCDECDYYWYEDPYADGGISIHGHQMLKQHVSTPILITEHIRNLETTTDIMMAGATDFARADPDYDGGFTGCYKTAIAAEALGMDCEVHSCGPAMRQLMAACRNSNYYEVNLVHPVCPNAWSLPFYEDGYNDELDCIDADGFVDVPDLPGMGVRYDWKGIEKVAVETRVVK